MKKKTKECFRKKKKSRILQLFLPDFTISIMVKTGLFLNAFSSFAIALKRALLQLFFLVERHFSAAETIPRGSSYPKTPNSTHPRWEDKEQDC